MRGLALTALVLLAGSQVRAEGGYEDRLLSWALKKSGRTVELHPEGKRVVEVLILTENVVAESDPWPNLLNGLHAKTRDFIVRQEMVIHEGDLYDPALVEESGRNLRRLFILATARIVPVAAEGGVALLVVTKDLWSLRLNTQYSLVGNVLELLHFNPSEQNFLGINSAVGADVLLKLDTLSLGQSFAYPRILGTPLAVSENASVIIERHTGQAEGSRGSLGFGKPLYTLEDTWGLNLGASWDVERVRFFRGPSLWLLPAPTGDQVPYVYDQRTLALSALGTYSVGTTYKTNLTAGWGASDNHYTVPSAVTDPAARAWFQANYLPLSQSASYLVANAQAFEARYAVMRDVETFAYSEDYQLGYSANATLHWATPAALSPTRFFEAGLALGYTWLGGDDLLSLSAAATGRWQAGPTGTGGDVVFVNQRAAAQVVNVTPRFFVGRVVTRLLWDVKADDLTHTPLFLGGEDGLRGTPAQFQAGTHVFLANLEYRTLPVELLTLHLGFVFFWDMGTAYASSPALTQVVGLGIRALFPQFDWVPLRVDIGYVVHGVLPPLLDRVSSSFGQVTDLQPVFLTQPL